jgi:anaerobic dimethyl sulfoxide reductase subunit A
MKRKNWEPGGGRKELRGRDEWVRISWEEALDLVSTETKRILDTYGNKAILNGSPVINALGGSLTSWGVSSAGAWPQPTALMAGGLTGSNDRLEWRKAKLIVLWNSNPIWSSGGNPTYNYLQAKKAGAKFIFVDPFYNDSAQVLADDWIPVRPSTDTALLLGIAYYMIENNLQDQVFLDKYTVGFDADHMPEGTSKKENFKDYVLGTYDGVPKTPEWASEICGTEPRLIRQFAQEIATTKPMVFSASLSAARTYLGQQFCQAFLTVGWMTGNVGISGGAVCVASHIGASYGGPALVKAGWTGAMTPTNPLFPGGGFYGGYAFGVPETPGNWGPAYEERWDAILNGKYTAMEGMHSEADEDGMVPCDIRMIWNIRDIGPGGISGGNSLNQTAGIPKGIEASRKVDFIVTNDIVLSTTAKYSDIVLPDTTPWEREGGGVAPGYYEGNPEMLMYFHQVTEPLYEARDGSWVERELASRLGVDPDVVAPLPRKVMVFNQLKGSTVMKADGTGYEPLLTITQADIQEWGVEAEPQRGRITLQEFMEKGIYQVPREPGDNFGYIAGKAYRDDPEANPLPTSTGKLEIHCKPLVDKIKAYRLGPAPAAIPKFQRIVEGVEDTYADWDAKIKGDYPLQLVTIHYGRRSHSVFDNILQLREAYPQECMMNPIDATERGVKHGDTVLIESRHGKVLRPLCITNRVMPGVFFLGEGAWVEMDEETGIDKAGATNTLNGTHSVGQGEEPWNSCNVQVKKWNGESLVPDAKWPQRIPIKEA